MNIAFETRVTDALQQLFLGKSRLSIQETHGAIVLREADERRADTKDPKRYKAPAGKKPSTFWNDDCEYTYGLALQGRPVNEQTLLDNLVYF